MGRDFILYLLACTVVIYSLIGVFFVNFKAVNKKFSCINRIIALLLIIWSQFYTKLIFTRFYILLLILSFPLSYLCYFLSLVIVGTKLNTENLLFFTLKDLKGPSLHTYLKDIFRTFYHSAIEELIYRGIFQIAVYQFTGNVPIAVLLGSLLFAFAHFKKTRPFVQMIDLTVFSIMITLAFQFSQNIWFCIFIHAFRNIFITNQQYGSVLKKRNRTKQINKILNGVK